MTIILTIETDYINRILIDLIGGQQYGIVKITLTIFITKTTDTRRVLQIGNNGAIGQNNT
jgi:hypothetical protein